MYFQLYQLRLKLMLAIISYGGKPVQLDVTFILQANLIHTTLVELQSRRLTTCNF